MSFLKNLGKLEMIADFRRYRKFSLGAIFIVSVAALMLLAGKQFNSDITDMLPADSVAAKMLRYLHEENIAGRITVELRLSRDCDNFELLPQTVKQLENSLKHREIISVFTGFNVGGINDLAMAYTALPQLNNPNDIGEIAKLTDPAAIEQAMRRNYVQLVSPGGFGANNFIENDPLSFNKIIFNKLDLFSQIIPYRISAGTTQLIGADRRRALLVIETGIPVSDIKRANIFLTYLENVLNNLPPQISHTVLCGHKHAIANEQTIAKDIPKISIASFLVFVLFFVLIYRKDVQSFLIILMPAVSVLLTVTIMALIMNKVSAFVVGFGGVMAGISIDYGICVYEICCKAGENRMREIRKIIRPLIAGALTTLAIFIAFLFSGTGAYIQLGIFAIISVTLSLLLSLWLLPNVLSDSVRGAVIQLHTPNFSNRFSVWIVIGWSALMLILGFFSLTGTKFDSSVTSLDAAGKEIIKAESEFNAYWNKRETPAMLVIKGQDREKVLQAGEKLLCLAENAGINGFASPSLIIPSTKTILNNQNNWSVYWTEERLRQTLNAIDCYGDKYGFSTEAFAKFKSWLPAANNAINSQSKIVENIQKQMLKYDGHFWTLMAYMPDTVENYQRMEAIQKQLTELRIISPRLLRYSIGDEELQRLIKIGIASFILVLLMSIAATGRIITGLVALLPVAAAITTIAGISALFKVPLTIPAFVAFIIIIGLSSDYGIFMVFRCLKGLQDDVMTAVTLCALTTAGGALTLLCASHPVMFNLGFALFSGIVVSYIVAVTLIPAIAVLLKKQQHNDKIFGVILLGLFFCSGCSLSPRLPESGALLSFPAPAKYCPPDMSWNSVAMLTFAVSGYQDSLLCAAEFDASKRSGAIVCMQPAGIKIFEASFEHENITNRFMIPQLQEYKFRVEDVITDLQRINFDNKLPSGLNILYEFDDNSGMLKTKKYIENRQCVWQVSFRQYKDINGYSVPYEIKFEHFSRKYSLLIKIKEFAFTNNSRNSY
jgi:predicted RND superfamily exporter protein